VMSEEAAAPRHSARWIAGAVAVVLVAFITLLATHKEGDDGNNFAIAGQAAPLISGPAIGGVKFDLNDHKGQWVLVNFFSTTCVPCTDEQPELVKWYNDHQIKGDASLVSVAFNEASDSVEKFFKDNGGSWPVMANDDGSISAAYGVVKLPESYLVDPNGRLQVKYLGAVTEDVLDKQIAHLTGSS
jgi:cytochrome c biogenesis protein CcmG/thiol:disulfide interchange protein DsbE